MKKLLITLLLILSLASITDFVNAEDKPKYFDTGYKVNGKTIWLLATAPISREDSICIENDNEQKECFSPCYFCRPNESEREENFLLPINDKGILYQADEFQVAYYDIETKEKVYISSDIDRFLSQYQIPDSGYPLDETYWAPFKDENFNEDKTKYALELFFYVPWSAELRDAMICILDIQKLTNQEDDYFECPIITSWLRRVETDKIDSNLWKNNDEFPEFKKWTDNGLIEIDSDKNEYLLNTSTSNLEIIPPKQIFSDIPVSHPLYFLAKKAKDQGWISGYPDGSFKPNKSVNRAEFAKMLMIAFGKGEGKKSSLKKFSDIYFDQWYVPYLSRSVELGVMGGYPDGTMKPGNTIIKAEALKMALEAAGSSVGSTPPEEQWYEKYRRYAAENFDLDFVSPDDMGKQMTRGECVELILEAM